MEFCHWAVLPYIMLWHQGKGYYVKVESYFYIVPLDQGGHVCLHKV